MENYSPHWRIRRFVPFLAFGAVLLAVFYFSIDHFIGGLRGYAQSWLATSLNTRVTVASVGYAFPNRLVASNVRIFRKDNGRDALVVACKKVVLPCDIISLIFAHRLSVRQAYLKGVDVFWPEFTVFVRDNFSAIERLLAALPHSDAFTLDAAGACVSAANERDGARLYFDSTFNFVKNELYLAGRLDWERRYSSGAAPVVKRRQAPLFYGGTLVLRGPAATVESLELKQGEVQAKLWGNWEGHSLHLNGFSYAAELSGEAPGFFLTRNAHARVQDAWRNKSGRVLGATRPALNIFDIDCLVSFSYPAVVLERLSFSFNDTPLLITGSLRFDPGPTQVDLKVSSYPDLIGNQRRNNPHAFGAIVNGTMAGALFNGDVSLDYLRRSPGQLIPETVTASFQNLNISIDENDLLAINAGAMHFTHRATGLKHELFFLNLTTALPLRGEVKEIRATGGLYDGLFSAHGRMDFTNSPFLCDIDAAVRGVSVPRLVSLLPFFTGIDAKFSGVLNYAWQESSCLKGKLSAPSGVLRDFQFFSWLANTFDLPSLKNVAFDALTFSFFVDDKTAKLENIHLKSRQAVLDGYYGVVDNMVASRISLTLPREVVAQSAKFAPLAKLLGELEVFTFDFQLSGPAQAPNFKLLDSEFKSRLQRVVPNFVQRGLEKKVEDILR